MEQIIMVKAMRDAPLPTIDCFAHTLQILVHIGIPSWRAVNGLPILSPHRGYYLLLRCLRWEITWVSQLKYWTDNWSITILVQLKEQPFCIMTEDEHRHTFPTQLSSSTYTTYIAVSTENENINKKYTYLYWLSISYSPGTRTIAGI